MSMASFGESLLKMNEHISDQMKHLTKISEPFDFRQMENDRINRMNDIMKDIGDNPHNRPAKFLVQNLRTAIRKLEIDTPNDKDILMILSVDRALYFVDSIGFIDPLLITFDCTDFDDNKHVWMMSHAAVKFSIRIQDRVKTEKRKTIGFSLGESC